MAHSCVCPNCNGEFQVNASTEDVNACTCDCPHCDSLLVFEGTVLKDFHKYMHSFDERWPEDGKKTSYITLDESSFSHVFKKNVQR